MFDRNRHIGFDIETSAAEQEYALQPCRLTQGQAFISSFATSVLEAPPAGVLPNLNQLVGNYGHTEEGCTTDGQDPASLLNLKVKLAALLTRCIRDDLTVVGWNVAFDAAWLCAYGFEEQVRQIKWLDGMLLWRHLEIEPEYDATATKKRSYGLKAAVAKYLSVYAGYEKDIDFHDMSPEAMAARFHYNKMDALFSLVLTEIFYNELAKEPARLRAALIEARAIPHVAAANARGLRIDTSAAVTLDGKLDLLAAETLKELEQHGATAEILASPKQLGVLLFDQWGLPIIKRSDKTGDPSTDKESLHELGLLDPRAKLVRNYREATGNRTKFVTNTLDSVNYNGDGYTRPAARIFGTYTSRMTFASKQGKGKAERPVGVAIHQWKRGKDYRNLIVAPEGYTIVEFDAAGQEFRWMAIESGDERMLQLCLPGEDPHGFMGAEIAHVDYRGLLQQVAAGSKEAKDSRQLGKVGNLSCQYRTSAAKLRIVARVQYGLPMELPEAQHIRSTYHRAYPDVQRYWQRAIAKAKRNGYAETLAGRRVQLKGQWFGKSAWSLESTAINYPIQGVGGDQKYLAIAVLSDYLNRIGGQFYFELHDGLYLLIPDHKVEEAIPAIRKRLNNLPYQRAWGFTPPIPLPWDCKAGKAWGSLVERHEE